MLKNIHIPGRAALPGKSYINLEKIFKERIKSAENPEPTSISVKGSIAERRITAKKTIPAQKSSLRSQIYFILSVLEGRKNAQPHKTN